MILVIGAAIILVPRLASGHDSPDEFCRRVISDAQAGNYFDMELANHAPDEIRSQAKTVAEIVPLDDLQVQQYLIEHPERATHPQEYETWLTVTCGI